MSAPRRFPVLALAAAGLLAGATARPEDGLSGHASLGASYAGRDQDQAKFREYWVGMKSFFGLSPQADLRYEGALAGQPFYAEGGLDGRSGLEHRATDGDAALEAGSYGLFKVHGSYQRIGHTFAYGARSLYGGIGTGDLTLDDNLQGAQQKLVNANAKANLFNAYEANAALVDLGLRRDRVNASVDLALLEPFSLGVDFTGEQRRGERPYGVVIGGPGSAGSEIAEPVNYDTTDVRVRAGYTDRIKAGVEIPVSANLAVAHSGFNNNLESVTYDNPVTLTDSRTGGAARGRSALPPSNRADTLSADVHAGLPWSIGLTGHGTVSRFDQNALLLPGTTNGLLAPWVDVPRPTAEARVANALYAGSLTLHPVHRLGLRLGYTYRQRDNRTPEYAPLVAATTDSSTALAGSPEPVSSIERTASFEQEIEVSRQTRLTTAVENEHSTYVHGSASMTNQNRFKAAVDTQATDWASVRVSGEHAIRSSDYPDYTAADGELPWMRKYYAADRDRDQVTLLTTLAAGENLDVTVEHVEGLDDYTHSQFGLQRDRHQASTVDLSYAPGDGLTLSTFVTREVYVTHQKSRQWTPGSVGDPYTRSPSVEDPGNWDLDSTTAVNTIGMTTVMQLIPDRLSAQLDGTAAVTTGKLDFASPFTSTNATGSDSNSFLPVDYPKSDETRWVQAGLSFTYHVTATWLATLAYRYDVWKIDDGLRDGYTPVAVNGAGAFNGLLTMDTLYKSYEVHSVMVRLSTRF